MIDRLLVRNTLYRALETDYVVLLGQRGTGVRTTINAFLNWSPLSFNMKFMSVALPRTIYNIDEFKELFLLRLVEATSNIAQEDNLANRISRAIQDNAARSIDFRLRRVLDILGKGFSTHHVVIAIHAFTDIPKEPLKNLLMILREYHDQMNFKGEAGEKLRFLVSGDLHLWELCYHKTNDLSPFNIARRIFLGGLSLEEIMMIDTNMDLTRAVGLRELTGGVPSLVEHAISMEKTVEDLLPFWGYLQGNWNALPVSSKDLLRSLVTDSEKFPTCLRDYDCPEIPVIDSPWMEAFWGGFLRTRYHELAWRSPVHRAFVMEYANAQGSISKSVLVKVDLLDRAKRLEKALKKPSYSRDWEERIEEAKSLAIQTNKTHFTTILQMLQNGDSEDNILKRAEQVAEKSEKGIIKDLVQQAAYHKKDLTTFLIGSIISSIKRSLGGFDIFLCYNEDDKSEVKEIEEKLNELGILSWIDEWEPQIEKVRAAAVFVGKDGMGPWRHVKEETLLRDFVRQGCHIIPVLLPNVLKIPELPVYLRGIKWIDFRTKDPDPMELLVWNITKKRISLKGYSEELDTPSPSLSHELNAQQDINEIRSIVGNKSFRDYHHLAKIIIRCMGIKSSTLIEAPYFEYGTAWEVTFPEIGLQLKTQRAVLVLRQKEEGAAWYKNLIKRTMNNAFILLIDIVDVPYSPFQVSPRTIWLSPETLIEMVQTPKDQLPGWLGRYITTRVERNIKQTLLPYATKGPAKMFVGRDYELAGLTRADQYGGIITGAHNSGKSSLLKELGKRLRVEGLNVIGPFELGSIGFQTFFERTLKPFDIAPSEDMTPEGWSSVLRNYCDTGTKPLFLLDEVDDLLNLDAQRGFSLGRQIRSLHNEGYCKFYLAGHAVLRAATGLQYGPFQNFANEVLLRGVTEEASKHLIQVPMKMIGFNVSDEQVQRIYKGTAGVPFLIQDFCIRLLCSLSPSQVSTPDIEASAIEEVEQSHDYLESVYQYYKYAQEWDSLSIMLIIAILGEATRRDIMQELKNRGSSLTRGEIDDILPFLIQFGIIEASKGDLFTIQSRYLYQALMMRDPEPLLDSFLVKGRSG